MLPAEKYRFPVGLVMAIMVVEEKDEENLGLLRKT